MLSSKQKSVIVWVVIALILIQPGAVVLDVVGVDNPLGNFWIELFTVTPPEDGITARFDLDVTKRGTTTTPSGIGYVWYDWNGNDGVDIGDIKTGAGEIEEVTFTSGAFTTSERYPIDEDIWIQFPASDNSGYQTKQVKVTIPSEAIGSGWDGNTAITISDATLMATESSLTVTVSEEDAGTLVTSSTDYNYTTYGTTADMTIKVAAATSDAGISTQGYTHWLTGKKYHGSFIGIKIDAADAGNCIFSSYDGHELQGSYTFVWWDLTEELFNDASFTDDGNIKLEFQITIAGAFDWNNIVIVDEVLESEFGQQAWGTADGEETDIDFVA